MFISLKENTSILFYSILFYIKSEFWELLRTFLLFAKSQQAFLPLTFPAPPKKKFFVKNAKTFQLMFELFILYAIHVAHTVLYESICYYLLKWW